MTRATLSLVRVGFERAVSAADVMMSTEKR